MSRFTTWRFLNNKTRKRWFSIGAVLGIGIFILGMLAPIQEPIQSSPKNDAPKLIIEGSVAADFRAVAVETWAEFLNVFWARRACFGDVRLRAARALDNRAVYDPETATVTVRIPATRAMLQGALVHEWAHHVEFQCDAHRQLRPAFLAAQQLDPQTPWRADNTPADTPMSAWPEIPSEQYAEATIELVLGRRQIPTEIHVSREAVQVIKVWAAGE